MKRLWIAVGILAVILSISGWSLYHLEVTTDQMGAELDTIAQTIAQQDFEKLQQQIETFLQNWDNHEQMLTRYIHRDELDTITDCVFRLSALERHGEYTELAVEIDRLRHLILHVRSCELPTFGNIL